MVKFNPLDDAELMSLIRFEARQLRDKLPDGYDRDDLESVGGEAACEALARADRTDPGRFKATLRLTVRNRMKDFLRAARRKARRVRRMAVDPDGNAVDIHDRTVDDPGQAAEARDALTAGVLLPRPDEAAAKAAALREAMFGAIRADRVAAMMDRIQDDAAKGSLDAARVLIGLISRPAPGPVQQVAVVVNGKGGRRA